MVHPRMHNASPQLEHLPKSKLHTSNRTTNATSMGSMDKTEMKITIVLNKKEIEHLQNHNFFILNNT